MIEESISNRLVRIEFLEKGPNLWRRFYSHARPIQYSYLNNNLEVWDQQTIFSGPPLAIEAPSASFAFNWEIIQKLEARGVQVCQITHSTGISNTGDPQIDSKLPFPEVSHISWETREKILSVKESGQRVIALGTGVVRALEGWRSQGENKTESFINRLKIDSDFHLQIVDGLITGFHEPGGSHLQMLSAFLNSTKLRDAYVRASHQGYLWHEYGDLCLIA